jgi:hypothetical protein
MKLPLVNEAEVPRAKIVDYRLDPNQEFAEALRTHARENEVTKQEATLLGLRLVVEGPLTLRDGMIAQIRSVWFIESGERVPRLTTAYPIQQRKI